MNANVDFIANGQSQGDVAQYLQRNGKLSTHQMRPYVGKKGIPMVTVFTGGDPKIKSNYKAVPASQMGLNVNATTSLRPEEWKELDTALIEVQQEELTVFDHIVNKGLVKRLNNPMGTTVIEWHTVSDSQSAIRSMDGATRGEGDAVQFKDNFIPVPIWHVDFDINYRKLSASRNMGEAIDNIEAAHAARKIREAKEDMIVGSGSAYAYGGGSIYSLFNFPYRNQVTLTKAWDDGTKTAAEILTDVTNMIKANRLKNFTGKQTLMIPTAWNAALNEDYSVSGSSLMTIRERILKLDEVEAILPVPRQKADNAALVQMTRNVLDVVNGLDQQVVQWATEGGMVNKYKVMEIAVLRLKADYEGQCGIAHLA